MTQVVCRYNQHFGILNRLFNHIPDLPVIKYLDVGSRSHSWTKIQHPDNVPTSPPATTIMKREIALSEHFVISLILWIMYLGGSLFSRCFLDSAVDGFFLLIMEM